MNVNNLGGNKLIWAVAKAMGELDAEVPVGQIKAPAVVYDETSGQFIWMRNSAMYFDPVENWAIVGPIIQELVAKHEIQLNYPKEGVLVVTKEYPEGFRGPNITLAALRAYVGIKHGIDVDVPDEIPACVFHHKGYKITLKQPKENDPSFPFEWEISHSFNKYNSPTSYRSVESALQEATNAVDYFVMEQSIWRRTLRHEDWKSDLSIAAGVDQDGRHLVFFSGMSDDSLQNFLDTIKDEYIDHRNIPLDNVSYYHLSFENNEYVYRAVEINFYGVEARSFKLGSKVDLIVDPIHSHLMIAALENERELHEPKRYYHVTPVRNLASIMQQGIQPRIGERSRALGEKRNAVYLFDNEASLEDAITNWLGEEIEYEPLEDDDYEGEEPMALLAIDLYRDLPKGAGFECISDTTIPPAFIKVLSRDLMSETDLNAVLSNNKPGPKP